MKDSLGSGSAGDRAKDPGAPNAAAFPDLLQAPVLHGLTQAEKAAFLNMCRRQDYPMSSPLLKQGQGSPGLILIAAGAVEVTSANAEGQSIMFHVARAPETLGEVEALAEAPCVATCTAVAPTTALVCPTDHLVAMTRKPAFLRNLAQVFFERLVRDNSTKFLDQFHSVEQRLCAYLHRLSVDSPEIAKTQSELAGLLGCARQTLNRELGRLRDSKIIGISKGRIRVLDRAALLRHAGVDPAPTD